MRRLNSRAKYLAAQFTRSIVLFIFFQTFAFSQTLDQQYDFYLSSKCNALNFERDIAGNILPGQAGSNLFAFCNGPFVPDDPVPGTTVTVNSTGGGAGASSASGERNDALRRRREQLRDEAQHQGDILPSSVDISLLATNRLGIFLSLDFLRERQDQTTYEAGRDSDRTGMVFGVDYRLNSSMVIGLALNQATVSGNYNSSVINDGGDFDQDNNALLFYGSWYSNDKLFFDFSSGIESVDQNSTRIVGRRIVVTTSTGSTTTFDPPLSPASSRSNSRALLFDVRGGYDTFLNATFLNAITVGPRFGLAYRKTKLDGFVENGNTPMVLTFNSQTEKSLLGSLGVQASKVFSVSSGVVNLQVNANWLHQLKDDQRTITARFAEDLRPDAVQLRFLNQSPDRNWFNLRLSTVAVFTSGLSGFIVFENNFGHDYLDQFSASVGLRKEF